MKIIDNMPIIIMVVAILANIAVGVRSGIGFSALMIRCIVVTIVFGVFGYMLTETVRKTIEYSILSNNAHDNAEATAELKGNLNENKDKSTLDIKVPPLDSKEFMNMDDDSDNEFVEVNPAYMEKYNQSE